MKIKKKKLKKTNLIFELIIWINFLVFFYIYTNTSIFIWSLANMYKKFNYIDITFYNCSCREQTSVTLPM